MAASLAEVAELVAKRAQRQGYVLPSEIRSELRTAELPEDQWKEIVQLSKAVLHYRQGRYYHVTTVSPRLHQEQEQQRAIARVIKQLVKKHRDAEKDRERRGQDRYDFIHPVTVKMEDGKEHRLLSRDLSTSGIRLLGTQRFLGKKVRVYLPGEEEGTTSCLLVRILWTCSVGDDLFENGGNFLEIVSE